MELKLKNGDYVKNGYHDLESVSGAEEAAQRIMMKLRARRGGFALMPDYGSRLYTLASVRPGRRESMARQFIAEALEGEKVLLEELRLIDDGENLNLELSLKLGGQRLNITTGI